MEKNPQPGGGLANSSYKVKEKKPPPEESKQILPIKA